MSYSLVLECGCTVYVAHDPVTNAQRSRVLERRGQSCPLPEHTIGARVFREALLADRPVRPVPVASKLRRSVVGG